MRKIKEYFFPLSLILTIPALQLIYSVLNNPDRGVNSLATDFDRDLPVIKEFVVPYMIWYVFIYGVLTYLCFKDRATYYRTLAAVDIGMLVCFFIYYFYQTTVLRPELTGDDVFTRLIRLVYAFDNPYNCFPSIHSLTSWLMVKGIGASKIRNTKNSFIVALTAGTIILSTLFIKQHVLLDAISAIILGSVVFDAMDKFDGEKALLWIRKPYLLLTMKRKLET